MPSENELQEKPEPESGADDSQRRFILVEPETDETNIYTGQSPSHALRKAARRHINTNGVEKPPVAKQQNSREIRLRERGTETVHIYTAWVWERPRKEEEPDWLNDMVVEVDLNKHGTT
jgi:hypothetical protein